MKIVKTVAIAAAVGTLAFLTAGGSLAFTAAGLVATGSTSAFLAAGAAAVATAVSRFMAPSMRGLGSGVALQVDAAAPRRVVYGRTRVPTTRAYIESQNKNNRTLHMVLLLAGHEIDAVEQVWFGDEVVPFPAGGGIVQAGRFAGKVAIRPHLGSAGQAADPDLVAMSGAWTPDHRLAGQAYLYVRLEWDQNLFTGGVPQISAVIRGKRVLDPRTGQTAWSDNAALCIRDYLADPVVGMGYGADELPATAWAAQANICDELVPVASGGTERRYCLSGQFDLSEAPRQILANMLGSCAGDVVETGGELRLLVGIWRPPSIPAAPITEDDLRGGLTVRTANPRRELFNKVTGLYLSAADGYTLRDFPPVASNAFRVADGGVELVRTADQPFTPSAAQAQRVAKIELLRARQPLLVELPAKLSALRYRAGDVVPVTLPRYGWTAKLFEVAGWRLQLGPEGVGVELTLRETDPSIFDWATSEEQLVDPAPDSDLPRAFDVAPPLAVTAVDSSTVLADGTVQPEITVTWEPGPVATVGRHRVRWRRQGDPVWSYLDVPAPGTRSPITPPEQGVTYDVEVAAVNTLGAASIYLPAAPVTLRGGLQGARVRALELFGQGTDRRFNGRDVRVVWDADWPHLAGLLERADGLGTGAQNPYLRGFVVRVYDLARGGVLARREEVGALQEYTYLYADNAADNGAPSRALRLAVSIQPKTGPELGLAVLDVVNPAPGLPTGLEVVPIVQGVRVRVDRPADPDWAGMEVHVGPTADFVPGPATLAYDGADVVAEVAVPPVGGWLRIGLYDAFGRSGMVFGAAVEVHPSSVAALIEGLVGEDALTDALRDRIELVDGPAELAGSVAARLADEAAQRLADVAAEALARGEALAAEALARATAISNEATLRQQGDQQLAQTVSTVNAKADSNAAAIVTEQQARVTAIAAEASERQVLAAQVNHPTTGLPATLARLVTEEQTRASADAAEASARQVLSAQVNDPTTGLPATRARLITEEQTRADGDAALASRATALESTVNHPTTGLPATLARLVTEEQTRASADAAEASARQVLSAQVNDPTTGLPATRARLITEEQTRATQDSALATQISQVAANFQAADATLQANITAANTARADGDAALATQINQVAANYQSADASLQASINWVNQARIDGDNALASQVSTVSTTVNGNTAAIQTQQNAINGLLAQWGLRVQTILADGTAVVAGIGLQSGAGAPSRLAFLADMFTFSVNGTPTPIAVITTVNGQAVLALQGLITAEQVRAGSFQGRTFVGGRLQNGANTAWLDLDNGTFRLLGPGGAVLIDADGVGVNVINTPQLVAGAVSEVYASTSGNTSLAGNGTWQTVASVTVGSGGSYAVTASGAVSLTALSGSAANASVRITVGGVAVRTVDQFAAIIDSQVNQPISLQAVVSASAGQVVALEVATFAQSSQARSPGIQAILLKR